MNYLLAIVVQQNLTCFSTMLTLDLQIQMFRLVLQNPALAPGQAIWSWSYRWSLRTGAQTHFLGWHSWRKRKELWSHPLVGQHSLGFTELLATAGGFSEYDVQLVSSLRPHHGPSSSGFALSRRPQVQSEKENVPTPQLGKSKPDRREHQKSQFKFGIRSGQTYPKLIAL